MTDAAHSTLGSALHAPLVRVPVDLMSVALIRWPVRFWNCQIRLVPGSIHYGLSDRHYDRAHGDRAAMKAEEACVQLGFTRPEVSFRSCLIRYGFVGKGISTGHLSHFWVQF